MSNIKRCAVASCDPTGIDDSDDLQDLSDSGDDQNLYNKWYQQEYM